MNGAFEKYAYLANKECTQNFNILAMFSQNYHIWGLGLEMHALKATFVSFRMLWLLDATAVRD